MCVVILFILHIYFSSEVFTSSFFFLEFQGSLSLVDCEVAVRISMTWLLSTAGRAATGDDR